MICAPYRPHLHKPKMATTLHKGTIAKEVIVAWCRIIYALYIYWGWGVKLWCVFYVSKASWAAKCKIQYGCHFTGCEPWVGKYLLNDLIWYMFFFFMFAGPWVNFGCVFYVSNIHWPSNFKIQDGHQLPPVNILLAKIWLSCNHVQKLCAYFQNIGSISYPFFHILNVPQNSKCKIQDGHQLLLVHSSQISICQMILCDTCFTWF